MDEIKVKTLDHTMKFNGREFRVGCQTISFDDAQKLAEFIQKQEKQTRRDKLPECFSLKIPNLSFGREVCKMLFELGIKAHGKGETLGDSLKVFDDYFGKYHTIYNVKEKYFSGSGEACYDLIAIDELIKEIE